MTLTRATREFLKRPVVDYFRQHFWVITSGYFTVPPLMCAREVPGSERILFSVDYPYSEMPQSIGLLKALEGRMPQPEIEQIAFKNAQELLRL